MARPVPLTRDIAGLALLFVASGTTHLVPPQVYEPIVPRALPATRQIVYWASAAVLVTPGSLGRFVL